MAILYSRESAKAGQTPPQIIGDVAFYGRPRVMRATIDLASQTTNDAIFLGNRRVGERFLFGVLNASATLGSTAQVAIGESSTHASNGQYRAAATFTAVNTPTLFGVNAAVEAAPKTAETPTWLTIGAAALPSSGVLVVDLWFVGP